MRTLATALLCLSASCVAGAQPRYASFTFENDFFAGYDRHYTNGLQAAFLVPLADLPAFARHAWPFTLGDDPNAVIAIGQRIYTPVDTDRREPDPEDRPYAGWLYALADVRTRREAAIDHVTVTLGVVGPAALARQTQSAFHHATGTSPVRGWSAQLRNEPAITVGWERAWPARDRLCRGAWCADLTPRVGGTVGNVLTYAAAGVVARFGTTLPEDLPATHLSLGPPRDGFRGGPPGTYVWIGAEARAVARNLLVQGNTFRDGPGVEREPFGHDVQVGWAWVTHAWRVGFTFVQRSREFRGQRGPDRYGQLAISLPY